MNITSKNGMVGSPTCQPIQRIGFGNPNRDPDDVLSDTVASRRPTAYFLPCWIPKQTAGLLVEVCNQDV